MKRGFTLIEALIVLVMIVVVAGLCFDVWLYMKALPKPWGLVRNVVLYGAILAIVITMLVRPYQLSCRARRLKKQEKRGE